MSKPMTRAVRAAALAIIVTGAGGAVAQWAPRFGGAYVYAAALISIAWLEGVVFGAIGALVAAAVYVLLFARGVFTARELVIALITSLLLPLLAIRRRSKTEAAQQLPVAPDGTEADALRVQLADALAKLYEANQQRERLCEQYESDAELLQRENEALRRRVDEERGAAEHLDETWSAKLQKIVAELATDHENDLGEAVAQREEARAEVRSLQMKVAAMQQAAAKSAAPRRPLILVVHNDPAMRRDITDFGFDTIAAADGLEALRMAVAHKPAVVVTDTSIPKMDGRELCQLIKSNPETSGVRVLLMTSDGRDDTGRELGPDQLLRKPVDPAALRAALARLTGSES